MANRKIIWTPKSIKTRILLYDYWDNRNKSKSYSQKLHFLFKSALKIVATFPKLAISTNNKDVRLKLVRDYQIVYLATDTQIIVLDIWDTRQNPENFPL
ncbi:type II toxin-antitoxin system RelE/ParE family toxin [Flavobacterium sp.]|uniref:type II toxin-antitoxin system RelE/ParE family toxin n=1 Tax=Flavobacterium sp. TaxID=239 RepID=UPI00286D2C45|nr:type II toxin-antitoxin system RelE/ParE family toxin [Flavobacterium sp.]